MDLITALSEAFDHTHGVIAGVKADQMNDPTPCREWDVAALLAHTTGVVTGIGSAVAGQAPTTHGDFVLAADVAAQFRAAADAGLAAWRAAGLDGETNIGAGPMPKQIALSINLVDTSTHSWDIARATNQAEDLPDDLAIMLLDITKGFLTDEIRQFAGFDPPVQLAPDASPTHKLVAYLGRQP